MTKIKTILDDECVDGKWVQHKRIDGKSLRTHSYNVWVHVRQRCTNKSTKRDHTTYTTCEMSEFFSDFNSFAEWHTKQVGYKEPYYQIDKDILVRNNKIYSENTCVLVPPALNAFFVSNKARRGEFPIGVTFNQREQKFKSAIRIDGKKLHLGYFKSADAAFLAYKNAKELEAKRWAERLQSGEYLVDERVITALQNWRVDE